MLTGRLQSDAHKRSRLTFNDQKLVISRSNLILIQQN